jgi:transcriptional regulator with XRE-family HTH domain
MPRKERHAPTRLAEKLLQIRLSLGLSQNELIRCLDLPDEIQQASVSGYELGTRIPPLLILLAYSQKNGICLDVLINDDLDLPRKLPSKPKHRY